MVEFRRATRQDALDLAMQMFLAGDRVDMQVLAEQLGVARGTLYRWINSREQLLDEILATLARDMYRAVREQASGDGLDRVEAAARETMEQFARFEPARTFVAREPQLAVKLIMTESGGVQRELTNGTRELLLAEGAQPGDELDDVVHVVTHIAASLVWVSFAVGQEPQVERAQKALRPLFRSALPQRDQPLTAGSG